jgi:hypothetical protein
VKSTVAEASSDSRDSLPRRKRPWRIFVAIEVLLLIVFIACFAWERRLGFPEFLTHGVSLLGVWLVFTLPIAVLYVIGHPPTISLAPLVSSPETKANWERIISRPLLDDDAYFQQYYASSGIRPDIPIRLRAVCARELGDELRRIAPTDSLIIDDELDLLEFMYEVQDEFRFTASLAEMKDLDDSFDSIVRFVNRKIS